MIPKQLENSFFTKDTLSHFLQLILQSPIAIAIFKGEDFIIEFANDAMLRDIWRLPIRDVQNKKLLDVFPELAKQKFPDLLKEVFTTGKPHREKEAVALIKGATGLKKFHLDFEYSPLFEEDNAISGVVVTAHDVSEKVETRRNIETAEQRSRLAIEAADLGTFDWNLITNEFIASKRLYEIFGLDTNSPLSHGDLIRSIHPEDLINRNKQVELSHTKGYLQYEARVLCPDNTQRWVKVYGKTIFHEKGYPTKMYGTVMDYTHQRMLNNELEKLVAERTDLLEQKNRELAMTNNELEQFAYVASHDLQEPLRKIRTYSDMLYEKLKDSLDEESVSYLQKVMSSSERMSNLIYDLLNFSRLFQSDKDFEAVDTSHVIKNVLSDFELVIDQKKAVVRVDKIPPVKGVPLQINQLFYNVINNALKFQAEGQIPSIEIRSAILSKEEQQARKELNASWSYVDISVRDNGIGFQQEYAVQIFDVFKRLQNKSIYPGSGIGLALCRKIAINHQGDIYAEGRENEGAVFHILLPVAAL
jgi:signal transduction histidine kinase